MKYLVSLGGDVNETNTAGQTAVHGAAGISGHAIIGYLASQGANLDAKDKGGRTPIDVTHIIQRPRPETEALIRSHGSSRRTFRSARRCSATTRTWRQTSLTRSSSGPHRNRQGNATPCAAFLRAGTLISTDLDALTDICKSAHGLALNSKKAVPLSAQHMPVAGSVAATAVFLVELTQHTGVNALAPEQTVSFGPNLTIVWENATGVRVIRGF